ncbi:hypothetical protein BJ684DRAFT_19119 [Piptocephalis cylindrospora]|uniref:G-protein coupled receptors family 3 profile domain-containing protein n=1 Tax=Piptocephalis cylindrospora TaxID=1907219 RepID=A0A4V1IYG5_9FUNG|nr:hypothetical protein BJ684DRAFT_19119 [Piptocephalis cylindrospora]|eukprot:RKP14479.1 hypothetical protein BJ684DRAFT_19119 [Piptocephalis cylindrospora]
MSVRRSIRLLMANPVFLHYLHVVHALVSSLALGLLTLHHMLTASTTPLACAPVAAILITALGLSSLTSFLVLFIKAHISLGQPMWMLRISVPFILIILVLMGLGYTLHDPPSHISPEHPLTICSVNFHPAWVGVKGGIEIISTLFLTWAFLCALAPSAPTMSMLDPARPYETRVRPPLFATLRREALVYALLFCLLTIGLSAVIIARAPSAASLYYYTLQLVLSSLLLTWHLDQPSLVLSKASLVSKASHRASNASSAMSTCRSSIDTMGRPISELTLSSSMISPKSFFSFDRSL